MQQQLYGPPSNVFFFQLVLILWMVTLKSYLIWKILSFILRPNKYGCVYAWTTLRNIATDRLAEDADFGKKNHLFRWSSIWSWQVCKQVILSHLGHRKYAYIEKSSYPKRVLVQRHNWPIFFENEQGKAITVSGDHNQAALATFGYNRTALRVTQPKLHLMFWVLFLKIVLLAAELMSFGHLEAAFWHRWTIICGVASKISITPTSQTQLTL